MGIALAVYLVGLNAAAEILIRFPAGAGIQYVSEVARSVERAVGIKAIGVVAVSDSGSEQISFPASANELLEEARKAYRKLDLQVVAKLLTDAESVCLDAAPHHVCRTFLFEINMLRGMAAMASAGEVTTAAAQAFRSAHLADPTRVLNPKLYPPNVLRAFANAWTASEALPGVTCRLSAEPMDVRFKVNGVPHEGATVTLMPGTHVVEASYLGFEKQYRVVEVAAEGQAAVDVAFRLVPEPDVVAWKHLIREISLPDFHGTSDEVSALLARFQIDHVLLLSHLAGGGPHLQAGMAFQERRGIRALPDLERVDDGLSEGFVLALMNVLGIEPPKPELAANEAAGPGVTVTGGETDGIDDFEDAMEEGEDDELYEDEDPSLQFNTAPQQGSVDEAESTASRVLKSPWLWISVGIVTAIVTGVVVSTQVED